MNPTVVSSAVPVLEGKQIFRSQQIPIYAECGLRSKTYTCHSHHFIEIAMILGGEGIHRSICGDHRLSRGDVFILRPGAWHSYEECHNLHIFDCCFGQELLYRELGWLLSDRRISHLLCSGPLLKNRRGVMHLSIEDDVVQSCRNHLDDLRLLLMENSDQNRVKAVAHLLLILSELGRSMDGSEYTRSTEASAGHPMVLKSLVMMNECLSYGWSTESLAHKLNMDISYFIRRFKTVTGLPPMAYLARLRAERAAELLQRTNSPIADIGRAVGWSDAYYFARRFKAHFGMTASQYRKLFGGGHLNTSSA